MSKLTVYKSNKIVEAAYKLSLNEQKVILFCISKNDSRQPLLIDDKFTITANEFAEIAGVDIDHAYKALQDVADGLFGRYVIIENPDANNPKIKQIKTRWISAVSYIPDSGALLLRFAADMLPYLSELKTQFTRYDLENIGGMKSAYGIRLYELLSQHRSYGRRVFDVEWLKEHLEITEHYTAIADLKRFVIDAALKDIAKTDLVVQAPIYEKTGRKVTTIVFDFKEKKAPPVAKKQLKAVTTQRVKLNDDLTEWENMRKRFGDKVPAGAIPENIIEQLKSEGRW